MLDDIVAGITGGLFDGAIVDRLRRRRRRRAEDAVAAGRPPAVHGALRRLTGSRWRRRWRHGLIVVTPGQIAWRPRLRPWPRIELTGVRILGRPRRPLLREEWSLSFDVWIYRIGTDGQTGYELAVVSESSPLFEDRIDRQAS